MINCKVKFKSIINTNILTQKYNADLMYNLFLVSNPFVIINIIKTFLICFK